MFKGFIAVGCHRLLALLLFAAVAACDSLGTSDSGTDTTAPAAANTPEPQPGNEPAASATTNTRAVDSERIAYAEVDEELVYGYFTIPSDTIEPLPAVILFHEWWGLNDDVRELANRLAAEGYIVLAVDLFAGKTADTPAAARQLMLNVVQQSDSAEQNIRQAFAFLRDVAGAPSVGAIGWGLGGGWSLNTAIMFPEELDATVIYYGQVTDDDDRLLPVQSPILAFFGANDSGVPRDVVNEFEASLERLRKNYKVHVYPELRTAFANPSSQNYNAAAAEDAWIKTLVFLAAHLSADDSDESS